VAADGGISWLFGNPFFFNNVLSATALTVGPAGGTLYAAVSNGVIAYTLNSDGALALAQGATPVPAGGSPSAIAISPSGGQLYVASAGTTPAILRFGLGADGSLPPAASATTDTGSGTNPSAIALTPDGRFLYVADAANGKIVAYSVDAVTGDLTLVTDAGNPYTAGSATSAPSALTMAPSGTYLYAALKDDGAIAGFKIDGATGVLSAIAGSPFPDGAPTSAPTGIAIAPDGTRLLAANSADGTIGRYRVTSGLLAPRLVDQPPAVSGARSVAFSPDSSHAYVSGSNGVTAFDVDAAAKLTAHGQFVTNKTHEALAITPDQGPTARVNPVPAPATTDSRFQGGPSNDPDGGIATWTWDFGDGTTASGDTVTHAYAAAGEYTVQLTVTDNEGCSGTPIYTGQQLMCNPSGFSTWSQVVGVPSAPDNTVPDQTCGHDGDDGFCGTPDHKAPQVTVLGFNNGAIINDVDAPTELVGSITPDPSGIKQVKLQFSKAAGTVRQKKTVRKKVCRTRRVHGKKRRICARRKVVVKTKKKLPACLTVSGTHNYLVKYLCSRVPWITIPGGSTFRYDLPVALGVGSYTVKVIAVDGAGNADVLESGRNAMTFKVVKTPSDTGTGSGGDGTTTPPTTTTTPPISDTGSPFGH